MGNKAIYRKSNFVLRYVCVCEFCWEEVLSAGALLRFEGFLCVCDCVQIHCTALNVVCTVWLHSFRYITVQCSKLCAHCDCTASDLSQSTTLDSVFCDGTASAILQSTALDCAHTLTASAITTYVRKYSFTTVSVATSLSSRLYMPLLSPSAQVLHILVHFLNMPSFASPSGVFVERFLKGHHHKVALERAVPECPNDTLLVTVARKR